MSAGARRYRRTMIILAVALVASVLLAVAVGAVWISPLDTIKVLAWKVGVISNPRVPYTTQVILLQLRLPRVLLAGAVGMGLAAAGLLFQGLFRNALADPAIIGVSSGAALGAVIVIVAGGAEVWGGFGVSAAAFGGAVATAFLVYRLSRIGSVVQVATLLLAGIAVAAAISSVMSLAMSFAGDQVRSIYFWLLGGVGDRGWSALEVMAPFLLIGVAATAFLSHDLNLVALGEERAAQLGVDLVRFKRTSIAVGALLAGAAVSVSGVIGFVGLMTPHVLRLIIGPDHRRLLPAVLLGGPTFLILADLIARTAIAPEELPLGAVTALVGAPFFLYLLRRERRRAGLAA